jgi:hypothetical protein
MCGLCGILGDGSHWTDGVQGAASVVPWLRRQARRERVTLGNAVLHGAGLTLADWQGSGFVLRARTGATEMVGTLTDLWPKADRLARHAIDPLDPAFLEALDAIGAE